MSTIPGGDYTTDAPTTISKNGFTANKITFPEEGLSTTAEIMTVGGHTGVENASTQQLTLSYLDVNPRSDRGVDMTIRPTKTNDTDNLYRARKDNNNSVLESMSIDEASDRSVFNFAQTTLGNDYMEINGRVNAVQTGCTLLTNIASVNVNNTQLGTTNGFTALNNGSVGLTTPSAGEGVGYWDVQTVIQPIMDDFDSFILKAGSEGLDDDTIIDMNNEPIKFSELDNFYTLDNKFIYDFVVDPTKHKIVQKITTSNVRFLANSRVPEGTAIQFTAYQSGSTDLEDSSKAIQYRYGDYPKYTFTFPPGSVMAIPLIIADGCSLPPGHVIPKGSNTNDVTEDVFSHLELNDVRCYPGITLPRDFEIYTIIHTSDYATVPKGSVSSLYQTVPFGTNFDEPLDVDSVEYPSGTALQGTLTISEDTKLDHDVITYTGTILGKNTYLPKGSKTLEGAKIVGELVIPVGSVVSDDVDLNSYFVIESSDDVEGNSLKEGAVIKGPAYLPAETQLTSNNVLPSPLKILLSMGVILKSGMEIEAGSLFGSMATLHGNINFSPKSIIPALSTLNGTFTLPPKTVLKKGFNMNVSIPLPDRFRLTAGTILYAGTSVREGHVIPPLDDIRLQTGSAAVYNGNTLTTPASVLSVVNDGNGNDYLCIKAHSPLLPGMQLHAGTIMSTQSTAGATSRVGSGTGGSTAGSYDINLSLASGSYSNDDDVRGPAGIDYDFVAGVPTSQLIILLSDVTFPTDLLVPLNSLPSNAGSYITFSETYVLPNDLTLTKDFVVNGPNSINWPPSHPIPGDFTLSSQYTFTTPSSGSQLTKDIELNVYTNEEFVGGIMEASATLKLPAAGYRLKYPIKLTADHPVSTTGSNALKTTVELSAGTKLLTEDPITLGNPLPFTKDFIVGGEITHFPRIVCPQGIFLKEGHTTPGDIHIKENEGLPKNITLSQSIMLSTAHTIVEKDYTFRPYTVLTPGTVLAAKTSFPSGANFQSSVMGPILSLKRENLFYFKEGSPIKSAINFPYISDEDGVVTGMKFDFRNLVAALMTLQDQLSSAELEINDLKDRMR